MEDRAQCPRCGARNAQLHPRLITRLFLLLLGMIALETDWPAVLHEWAEKPGAPLKCLDCGYRWRRES